jgi:hypothetical protein
LGYGGKQASRSGDIRRFNFTGNGSNTAFDLGFTPATQNQLIVTVNGLVQHYDAFSISGSTINFTGTPASGDTIQVTAVVDAVGVAAIPDGAVANVSSLAVSGAATLSNTFVVTGNATFSNTVAVTGTATFSSTANVAQGLTANTLTVSTNTATFGTAMYSVANGNIGIGTASPSSKLEIPDVSANGLRLSGSGDHALGFTGYSANAATQVFSIRNDGISNLYINTQNSVPLNFGVSTGGSFGSTTSQMRIDSSGRITMPYQPAFDAYGTVGNLSVTTEVPIPLNSTTYNIGSHYSTSTYRFTAPVAGLYFFRAQTYKQASGNASRLRLYKNAADARVYQYISASDTYTHSITGIISLSAGDYVTCNFNSDGAGTNIYLADNHTNFSGYFLG